VSGGADATRSSTGATGTSWTVRLATAGIGLLVGLLTIETVPRLVPQLMPAPFRALNRLYDAREAWQDMMRGDRELGFVLRPGLDMLFPSEGRQIAIRTVAPGIDGIGYRDIGSRPPFDAIALGDSFTFCDDVPVEHCWVRHLGEASGLSIATLGTNGYSTIAEARLLARVGKQVAPRLVLLGVFPNDFKDNVYFDEWTRTGSDDYWQWRRAGQRGDVGQALLRHSIVYRVIDGARRVSRRRTYHHQEGGLDFVFRADDWWLETLRDPDGAPGLRLMQEALREMRASAAAVDAQLVVLLFPFKEAVYWDVVRRYEPAFASLDVDGPLAAVGRVCAREGIPVCDLTPALRAEAAGGRQLYHSISAHWNDEGNAAAARAIGRCLDTRGVLEAARRPSVPTAAVRMNAGD
jgi:hypothetical protein